jgi:hypothetical protein
MGQAAIGTEQDFYGPAAWAVNHTIVCKGLTGMSNAAILADPVLSVHIATNSSAGAFAFTAPTRELRFFQGNRQRGTLENMEDAYHAVLYNTQQYHGTLGTMDPAVFLLHTRLLADLLYCSAGRGSLHYHRHDPADPMVYRWFFVTGAGVGCAGLWAMMEDTGGFKNANPHIEAYVFFECRQ